MKVITMLALVLILATSAMAMEYKAVQMKDDFGTEPLYSSYLRYYYYIYCTTSSWFWAFTGWTPGDIVGVLYTVGDPSMGRTGSGCPPYLASDPCNEVTIESFRVLDFGGYGTLYPGLFTVEFDVFCADADGCPVGPSLWNSGPVEFCAAGWNYVYVNPQLCVTECATQGFCYPRFLATATFTGTDATYPAFGFDNMTRPITLACNLHDSGCCPALYPRPYVSHYPIIHAGYYGPNFTYCPPQWFLDGGDTTSGGTDKGFIELAWTVYLVNSGPTATEPSTWGNIKSMYR